MSVNLERCGDTDCSRLFEVEQFSEAFGRGMTAGRITCPHCHWQAPRDAHKVYVSRKIAPELEDWPEN